MYLSNYVREFITNHFLYIQPHLRGCFVGPLVPDDALADRAGRSHSSARGGRRVWYSARLSRSDAEDAPSS